MQFIPFRASDGMKQEQLAAEVYAPPFQVFLQQGHWTSIRTCPGDDHLTPLPVLVRLTLGDLDRYTARA